jgi:hypothetical protein
MFYCCVKQQNNNNMVDVILTCQSRRKILYTIGLGFMLILGLQGIPGGPKDCIKPYIQNTEVQSLCSAGASGIMSSKR